MADDDIIPLRRSYALSMVERISELEAEVERLRAAGDALAESRSRHIVVTPDPLLDAWKEARRG